MTNSKVEFIEALYVVTIYKPPKMQVNCCNSIYKPFENEHLLIVQLQ
jgi:hypothetical protein